MDESKLKVFIEGATRYFVQVTRLSAEVGTPYLSETNETLAYDMTGICASPTLRAHRPCQRGAGHAGKTLRVCTFAPHLSLHRGQYV
jgi:hypothetical protein